MQINRERGNFVKKLAMLVEEKRMTYGAIRKSTGEGWALVLDPEFSSSSGKLSSGTLIFFSKNKQDVHDFILKDKNKRIKHYSIVYTGSFPEDQIFVL